VHIAKKDTLELQVENPSGTSEGDVSRARTKSQDLRTKGSPTKIQTEEKRRRAVRPHVPAGGEEETEKELLIWFSSELKQYHSFLGSTCDFTSFSSGDPFLALLHKHNPSLVDLETFDRSDRIKTLTTVFELAEQHLNVANLLDPYAVANNLGHRQLLLYLTIWREKTEQSEIKAEQQQQILQNELQKLFNVMDDAAYNVDILNAAFEERCGQLRSNIHTADRERLFDEESTKLFDELMEQAMETLVALETKHELLLKKNLLLNEKFGIVRECKILEENARKKVEMQFALEENIKAIGEVLSERGVDFSSSTNAKPTDTKNDDAPCVSIVIN